MKLLYLALASAASAWLHPAVNLKQQMLTAEMNANGARNTAVISAMNQLESVKGVKPALNVSAPYGPIYAENYTVPLDHFNGDPGTFQVRYWVQESDYQPGGPVFVYDVGEGDAEPGSDYRLQNETSFFKQLTKQFNGIGIVIEHRYYGKSLPFNISVDTPASQFQYLTAEQALADFPVLAHNFTRANFSHVDLTPRSTPWIFIGGSYSGMRAAFLRKTYPDAVFAAYTSSSPVEARVDMTAYFEQVYRGMVGYGFNNCTADVHAAFEEIDNQLNAGNESANALKVKFLGPGSEGNSIQGFADALSVVFFAFQSYGMEGAPGSLRQFCDWISTDPATNRTSFAEGWATHKGAQWTIDRWASWPDMVGLVNMYTPTRCFGHDIQLKHPWFLPNGTAIGPGHGPNVTKHDNNTVSCRLDDRTTDPGTISWAWQYCSQFGFFQAQNKGPNSLVSRMNTLERQQKLCYNQFPDGLSSGFLPAEPQAVRANQRFGGWDLQVSNTFWVGGQYDPWRTLGVFSEESFAPEDFRITQAIPRCGAFPDYHVFFGTLLPDAQHCYDFRTTFPAGNKARSLFTEALKRWLPCFREDRRRSLRHEPRRLAVTKRVPELSDSVTVNPPLDAVFSGPSRIMRRYPHRIEA